MTDIQQNLDMVGVIDYLRQLLQQQFSGEISYAYFGDIGSYPPQAFNNDRNQPVRAVLAISPRYDRLVPEQSNAAYEVRRYGFNITLIVNILPYFEAMPDEAFGERALAMLVGKVRMFLAQNEMLTLYGRVSSSRVLEVDWEWADRSTRSRDQMTREATILLETLVHIRTQ